jgi:hypothetical protein
MLLSCKLPMQMVMGKRRNGLTSEQYCWLCSSPLHSSWAWDRCRARAPLPYLGISGSCCGGRSNSWDGGLPLKRKVSPEEFADELERHLDGTDNDNDWDRTSSVRTGIVRGFRACKSSTAS